MKIRDSVSDNYKRGDELAWAIRDIQSLTERLKTTTSVLESSPQTRNDAELLALAREVESLANKLTLLAKLRPKGTDWRRSLWRVGKYRQHQREFGAEIRRLDTLRANLELIL
jgi:hypothetical protein